MIALALVRAKLQAAWAWMVTHWRWLLPPLAILAWLLERALTAKPPPVTVESGAIVGHDQAVAAADEVAARERAAADVAAIAETRRLAAQHEAAAQQLEQGVEKAADQALEDPDKTNAFLTGVGKDMRK